MAPLDAFLLALALIHLGGLAIVVVAAFHAPTGYEDAGGFHRGEH